MPAETLSSQTHVIFIPPAHFSNVILQRGTIIMFMPAGVVPGDPSIPGAPGILMPGMPIPARSVIIVVMIDPSSFSCLRRRESPSPPASKPKT